MTDEELQLIEDAVMFYYEDFNYDECVTQALNAWKKLRKILKMKLSDEEMKRLLKWNYDISDEKADDLIIFIKCYVSVSLEEDADVTGN